MSTLLTLILLAVLPAQEKARPKVELQPPMTMKYAGVTMSVPKGFETQLLANPHEVVRAVKYEKSEPILAVNLSALPATGKVTLGGLVKDAQGRIRNDLAVRGFKVVKTMPLRVAGVDGEVHILSYRYRGVDTTAFALYFIRSIPNTESHIGYALTVEAEKKRGREALPLLGAVAESIKLFDPVRPSSQPIVLAERAVVSRKFGFSIRPPMFWKLRLSRSLDQVIMYQTDYLRRGIAMPQVSLLVRPETKSAEDVAIEALSKLEDAMKKDSIEYQLLSRGVTKMAGHDGYEFFIRQQMQVEDRKQEAILARRTICAGGKSYSLVLLYDSDSVEAVRLAIDAIAGGFKVMASTTTSAPAGGGFGGPKRGGLRSQTPPNRGHRGGDSGPQTTGSPAGSAGSPKGFLYP